MRTKRLFVLVLLVIVFGIVSIGSYAIKNLCPKCNYKAQMEETVCSKCGAPLNKCLECECLNTVAEDYCKQCGEPLAEMRVLGKIDPELREELRLGQSDRAQLERELGKIKHFMEKEPEKEEIYLYRIAKIYKRMKFFAKEAQTWEEYLAKFPDSPRKSRVKAFQSEALRQWGYLFYQQKLIPEAIEKFERAVEANPMNAEAWSWLGRVCYENNKFERAIEAYTNVLKVRPKDSVAINFLRKMKKNVPDSEKKKVGSGKTSKNSKK